MPFLEQRRRERGPESPVQEVPTRNWKRISVCVWGAAALGIMRIELGETKMSGVAIGLCLTLPETPNRGEACSRSMGVIRKEGGAN